MMYCMYEHHMHIHMYIVLMTVPDGRHAAAAGKLAGGPAGSVGPGFDSRQEHPAN